MDILIDFCLDAMVVCAVLAGLFSILSIKVTVPEIKDKRITKSDIAVYSLYEMAGHKPEITIEEWKPVRYAYNYWFTHYRSVYPSFKKWYNKAISDNYKAKDYYKSKNYLIS